MDGYIFKQDDEVNETHGSNKTDDKSNMAEGYLTMSLVSIYSPFAFVSNAFVVIAVAKYKRLQTPANLFVVSLSVADIFVVLALPLYAINDVRSVQVSSDMFCLAINRTLMAVGAISMLTLAVIACDRYLAIVKPLEYRWIMTKRKACMLVSFIYIHGTLVSWIPFFLQWYHDTVEYSICPNKGLNSKSRILYVTTVFMPSCLCVLFCYTKIFLVAQKHARAIAAIENIIHRNLQYRWYAIDTKHAKTIALVILIFAVFWTPYHIVVVSEISGTKHVNPDVKHYSLLFAFVNSGINPWIYAYKNNDFRKALKILLLRRQRENNDGSLTSTRRSSVVSQISILPSNGYHV